MSTKSSTDPMTGTDRTPLVALAVALWAAAVVHHVDDIIAGDHVGSPGAVTLRTAGLLAIHLWAIVLVREDRALGDAMLGAVGLWWFATVFVAHVVAVTRPVDEIATSDPTGWAPVFLGAIFVGGAVAPVVVGLSTRRLFRAARRAGRRQVEPRRS